MKKVLLFVAAAVIAFTACQKPESNNNSGSEQTPGGDDKPSEPDAAITLSSDAIVDLAAESSISKVTFNATKAWTAELSFPQGEEEGAVTIDKTSGDAGDAEIKVVFQGLPEDADEGRYVVLILKSGNVKEKVQFFQGKVFWAENGAYSYVPKAGADVSIRIFTNVKYEFTKYDSFEEWAPVTMTETSHVVDLAFKVAANTGFDAREAYVKFVTDELGTYRYYVQQEGSLQLAWTQNFTWSMFPEGTRESIADVGDYIIINSGLTSQSTGGMHVFKKADGSYVKTLEVPSCTGITNDDAGNIVISAGGTPYDSNDPLVVFAFTKAAAASIVESGTLPDGVTPIIQYVNGFYGYGLDNLRVTGDITGDAIVTMVTSGGTADFYACDWEIKGGKYTGEAGTYTQWIQLPNNVPGPQDWGTPGIWASKDIVAKHVSADKDSKVFYNGYDFYYNLQLGTTGAFETVLTIYDDPSYAGNEGYPTLATAEWNGHKYLSFIGMPYFAWADWDGDEVIDDNLPGYLWLLNIDDPANPVVESVYEYYCDYEAEGNWQYGDSADVRLVVEGNDLVAYVVDAASSQYMKVVYPKQ
jgi:hypothetical protein